MGEPAEQGMRADAVRSRARLLESAAELIARDGAEVSLEAIARAAGVGSATLHRHFPTRWDLLEAIFKDRALQIAKRAEDLLAAADRGAFARWFSDFVEMVNSTAGLAAVIEPWAGNEASGAGCYATITAAGNRLLAAEKQTGTIRPDLQIDELMAMATAISSLPTHQARRRMAEVVAQGWSPPRS